MPKANKSFGATTLRKRHAKVKGATLKLQFKAKSGKMRVLTITDRIAQPLRQEMPGPARPASVPWLDDDGEAHPVTSSDVNDYIREATGERFHRQAFPHLGRERRSRSRRWPAPSATSA